MLVQIDTVVPGLLGTRNDFGTCHCGGFPTQIAHSVYDWQDSSNLGQLNAILQTPVLIRGLNKDVMQALPAKMRQRVTIELDGQAMQVSKHKAEAPPSHAL